MTASTFPAAGVDPSHVVRTVLGDVSAQELGHVATHEHLLVDLARPPARDLPVSERARYYEPIRLDNYHSIRQSNRNMEDRRLLSEEDAVAELVMFRELGGGTIVDATTLGLGRDAAGLARVARAAGVHVVMGAGYYVREFHPDEVSTMSEEQLAERIVRDINEGDGASGVRAGIIGEIGLTWPPHPDEEKVLRASARAQRQTGTALMIHPGRDAAAPFTALEQVEKAGVDLNRVVMCHVERTYFDAKSLCELAARGCYVEFDLFGQESSYYAFAPIDMPNDARRMDLIGELVSAGYLEQVLLSQDVYRKTCLRRYGGEGYGHILSAVIPRMRTKGFSDEEIEFLCRINPAHMLSMVT